MNKLIVLVMLILCSTTAFALSAGTEIQQNLPAGYEPSGIEWLSALNKLALVSDGGTFSTMNIYGTEVTSWNIGGYIEGVSRTANSNTVYIVTEYPMAIREVDATHGQTLHTWSLTGIVPNPPSTNSALEGIAYVPASENSYGIDIVVVGMQGTGELYALALGTTATLLGSMTPYSSGDLSDLFYNSEENLLYILYDSENIMKQVNLDGTVVATMSIPGYDQEGIAVLPACPTGTTTLFIAEDSGRVMTYTGFATTCPATPPTDSDSDGVPDSFDICPGYDDNDDRDNDGTPDGCDTVDDRDEDSDGLTNAQELVYGTNAQIADTDGDALNDGLEIFYRTNPLDSDSDNGGVLDGQEITNGTNPLDASDDISADPNKITGYLVNKDATVLVNYADNTMLTIDPYAGYTQINAGLNSNSDRLIVTNGKYVSVYRRNTRIAHTKIATSIPNSNTMSITNAGSYDLIVVQYPLGRKTATVTLKLENDRLSLTNVAIQR